MLLRPVYGHQKQGASHGHTKIAGKQVLRKDTHWMGSSSGCQLTALPKGFPQASSRIFRIYRALPLHYHNDCDEHLYVVSGEGVFHLDGSESRARPGTFPSLRTYASQRDWDDAHLINAALDIHADDPEFGYRFIADELAVLGFEAGENRVQRLCSLQGIYSAFAKKRGLTVRPGPPVHDDLVRRDFTATGPNRLWLTDISEHRTAWIPAVVATRVITRRPVKQSGPALQERAAREGAVILFADQVGVRPDHLSGATWGRVGHTPMVARTGKRFSLNAMSAISPRGDVRFTVFAGRFTTTEFLAFCQRLIAGYDTKIRLVLDGHPVHRAKATKTWMAEHRTDRVALPAGLRPSPQPRRTGQR